MESNSLGRRSKLWLLFLIALSGSRRVNPQQRPTIKQASERSICSNVVAISGSIDLHCGTLNAEQIAFMQKVPALLQKLLSKQIDITLLNSKLDQLLQQTAQPAQNVTAPNGIGNIGGTLINPQVNNYGPPRANLTFTEDAVQVTPISTIDRQTGNRVTRVHVRTDRSIAGAVIGIVMSGPIVASETYWQQHGPSLIGSGAQQIDLRGPLTRDGKPIPNSIAILVNIPASFSPSQDLVLAVPSTEDVHVVEVLQIP